MGSRGSDLTDAQVTERRRWLALYVICAGAMMMVIDGTIVNVALPTIKRDLDFTQTSAAWIVNSYLITFGGFLLLGGRLADVFGAPRLFRLGIVFFSISSFACGVADTRWLLVVARAIQGFSGAIVLSVALSLIVTLFRSPTERAKAMGVYGMVLSCGSSSGVILGGVITTLLSWNWIFFVNIPVGIVVYLFSRGLVHSPEGTGKRKQHVDVAGAVTVTSSLMIAVYAIINGNSDGWTSPKTLTLLAVALVLLAVFVAIESRIKEPLLPLSLFRLTNVAAANTIRALFTSSMFAFFFFTALYLQLVLGYTPLKVGIAYLPFTVLWGVISYKFSDKIVLRFGARPPMVLGMLSFATGCLIFTQTPVNGNFLVDILPGMILMGFGGGIAMTPMLLAGMSSVGRERAGTASGLLNTSGMMGGALGLAVLASIAATRTTHLLASGAGELASLNGGYHIAFLAGAIFAVCGVVICFLFIRPLATTVVDEEETIGIVGGVEVAEVE